MKVIYIYGNSVQILQTNMASFSCIYADPVAKFIVPGWGHRGVVIPVGRTGYIGWQASL
jgi:hypothetical protein